MSKKCFSTVLIRGREVDRLPAANPLKWNQHSFRARISATRTDLQTPTSATDQQLTDSESDFKLCTEWA